MSCAYSEICGGCTLRDKEVAEYRHLKEEKVKKLLSALEVEELNFAPPIFIADGTRRRAAFAFSYQNGRLTMGFNENRSSNLVDVKDCPLLTPRLNANLTNIRRMVEEICAVTYQIKKGRRTFERSVTSGDVLVCDALNGIDVVLEYDGPLDLGHRIILFELGQSMPDIIRVSQRRGPQEVVQPVLEKSRPYVRIGKYDIQIPAGTFLQPSAEGEAVLTSLVSKYMQGYEGRIIDLFCGVGTFSYVLAENVKNKIFAVDSSPGLLNGFKETINHNMIPNITVIERNLFKYPLDQNDLRGFGAVVFDPPRAGAAAQVQKIAAMSSADKPERIIAVSCNPQTFLSDAGQLLKGGYILNEVTMVDQFVYSEHCELVALFTKKG